MKKIALHNGCYGCPFLSRMTKTEWYCGAKTVLTNGESWKLPPESSVVGEKNKSPEWCPLPVVIEGDLA
jgi:hypothetical protein